MPFEYNEKLVGTSQHLRKEMTDEDKQIWYHFFKRLPITVRRQKVIGNYIVDFYIASAKIVIEIDGIQHKTSENKEKDAIRDKYMSDLGILVLRFSNVAVNNYFNDVCNIILKHLNLTLADLKPIKK